MAIPQVVLGGRDGTAQPMARGDMEQYQIEDGSWAPVKTKMTLERSYQCAAPLARWVSTKKTKKVVPYQD